ncbi:MAG: hypothetical protein HN348_09765 [Proteobacteria bacterium]|jgi:hypothetical protein|nr:hypothetical protein [Pseudomonadota bacterium]
MKVHTSLILGLLAISACSRSAPEQQTMSMSAAPWTISYHDGSGNGFRFWHEEGVTQFEYSPITPEISSSGIYDGGAAKMGKLDHPIAAGLWQRVEELQGATSKHIEAREMGTGAFTITTTKGEKSFIMVNGPLLEGFNSYIEPLRGNQSG